MSPWMLKALLIFFVVIAIVALCERNWNLLKWSVGAALIQWGVIGWTE